MQLVVSKQVLLSCVLIPQWDVILDFVHDQHSPHFTPQCFGFSGKKSGWFSLRPGTAQFDQVLNVDEQGSRTPQSILLLMSAFGCSISECNCLENYNFCYLEKKTQTS